MIDQPAQKRTPRERRSRRTAPARCLQRQRSGAIRRAVCRRLQALPAAVCRAFISGKAALAAYYATQRFNLPTLHAALIGRLVVGNKVIDHERVTGLGEVPTEAALVFEVVGDCIQNVWFYSAQ